MRPNRGKGAIDLETKVVTVKSIGKLRFGLLACLSMTTPGCAQLFDASTLGVKATVAEPAGQAVEGVDFEVTRKAVYLVFGALQASKPSLENALAAQLVDGAEIQNLSIRTRSRWGDVLITMLTFGLIVPRSVTFTGTVVGTAPAGN